jgi:hypothetical protein
MSMECRNRSRSHRAAGGRRHEEVSAENQLGGDDEALPITAQNPSVPSSACPSRKGESGRSYTLYRTLTTSRQLPSSPSSVVRDERRTTDNGQRRTRRGSGQHSAQARGLAFLLSLLPGASGFALWFGADLVRRGAGRPVPPLLPFAFFLIRAIRVIRGYILR